MLAKSPQDRFSSMSELISAISRLDVDQSETVIIGDVTVESPRNDLHVSMKGERTFSVGTNDETEQLSATTSHEGMKVTAGNISALTRDIVLHSGADREIRLTMAPQSELPTEIPPAVTDQQTFDLRLVPLITSDSQIADWTKPYRLTRRPFS